jgi:hypothetical protein
VDNWFALGRQSVRTIGLHVVGDQELSSLRSWVEEEADESAFWMEMIIEGELLKPKQVEPLLNEANELTKIMAQSRISGANALARTMKRQTTSKMVSNRQSAIGNRQ